MDLGARNIFSIAKEAKMKVLSVIVVVLVLVTGCGGTNVAQPSSTPTTLPTATPDAPATSTAQAAASATSQAQASVTAQAIASATALAQSTATAQAQATALAQQTASAAATQQALLVYVDAVVQKANKAYGPVDGTLDKPPEATSIKTLASGVYLRNFVAEARFTNPADGAVHPWDYGFLFRRVLGGRCGASYRVYVSFDQRFRLALTTGKTNPDQTCESKTIVSGIARDLNISPTGSNLIRLVVQDKSAFLFANGVLQAVLDVSEHSDQGDVIIGTAFQVDHGFPGLATPFKNFVISSLP